MIKEGTYVLIEKIVLEKSERAENIPPETKEKPLIMHIKGFLKHNADLNEEVEIRTMTNRTEKGILKQVNPYYSHNFGKFVEEVMHIRLQILKENDYE